MRWAALPRGNVTTGGRSTCNRPATLPRGSVISTASVTASASAASMLACRRCCETSTLRGACADTAATRPVPAAKDPGAKKEPISAEAETGSSWGAICCSQAGQLASGRRCSVVLRIQHRKVPAIRGVSLIQTMFASDTDPRIESLHPPFPVPGGIDPPGPLSRILASTLWRSDHTSRRTSGV